MVKPQKRLGNNPRRKFVRKGVLTSKKITSKTMNLRNMKLSKVNLREI